MCTGEMEEVRKRAMRRHRKRALQAGGTARAKAPGPDCAWHVGGAEKAHVAGAE